FGQTFGLPLGPAILDREIMALDPPQFAHSLHEGGSPLALRRRVTRSEQSDGRRLRLLRARRKRPRGGRPAQQRDELPAPHSITPSARVSRVGGTVSPNAFAVWRLTTRRNFTGLVRLSQEAYIVRRDKIDRRVPNRVKPGPQSLAATGP